MAGKNKPLTTAEGREMEKENMLQLGWLTHRYQSVNDEEELETRLRKLAVDDPQMAEQIDRSTLEEKQTIILNQIFENPQGFPEVVWFRVHFPSDKGLPLAREYQLVLDTFETDPDGAYAQLDQLFQASIKTH
jgi:hypothetical protein